MSFKMTKVTPLDVDGLQESKTHAPVTPTDSLTVASALPKHMQMMRQASAASVNTVSSVSSFDPQYKDPEYMARKNNPLATRRVTSDRTLINIVKGMIGPGCFSLPLAFRFGGLWTGILLTLAVGMMTAHSMSVLVHCAQHLCARCGKLELDYGHLAKKAIDYGPMRWRKHSRKALYVTNSFLVVYQMGVCSVCFVFIGSNLQKVVKALSNEHVHISTQAWIAIALPCVICLNFVRRLRILAYFSAIGNIILIIGLVIVFQYIARPSDMSRENAWFGDFHNLLLFVGSVLYSFEGQAMILPMENRMTHPQDLCRPFGVLHTAMGVTTLIYVAVGFFGYAKFGSATEGSITLNLPNEPLYQAVVLLTVLVIFFGMPVQEFVIIAALWPSIKRKLPVKLTQAPVNLVLEYCFRFGAILFQFVLAMVIPQLELIIPLVGVTAGMTISFILPAVLDMITFWNFWELEYSPGWRYFYIVKDCMIIAMGLFGMISGLYVNITQIVETL